MARLARWVGIAGCVGFLAASSWLGSLERSAPPHADVVLEGGVPATFYLPGTDPGLAAFLDAPPRGERPPAVALMHGFASDRLAMSVLARRLARAGYAVLAFDASGHGQNRNPFRRSFGRSDSFHAEVAAAVDFLRADPRVDGERIVVMGHSMGAGASLDFATRDAGLDATVLISGGWTLHGPHRPPNALFIYAALDPETIEERSLELAARIAGVTSIEPDRTYGAPSRGTGVRVVEVPGADHLTIVWDAAAALQIVRWLDDVFARPPTAAVAPDRRPIASLLAALSLLLALPAFGVVVGRLAPSREQPPAGHPLAGLAAIALALLATMPLLAVDAPFALLSVEVGDVVVSHLGLAGVVLLVAAVLLGRPSLAPPLRDLLAALPAAAVGILGLYVLLLPVGAVLHRLALVPERAVVFALASLGLLPFSLAYQGLLRRGSPRRAALVCVAGRALVLGVLGLGEWLGLLSFVVVLMLPALAVAFLLFELLCAFVYATSRNVSVVASLDAAWLGLVFAATMPVSL